MTSPQKWTTGQDSAEQPGIAERPLPSPADDAPTQQDDATDAKSTDTKSSFDEARADARHERKAGPGVASGSPTTESRSDVTTEAPATTRTGTPSQQTLSALLAVRSSTDEAIAVARLQLKAEAEAATGSPPTEDLSAKMSKAGQQPREKMRASAPLSVLPAATQEIPRRGARLDHGARPSAEQRAGEPPGCTLV